LLGIIVEEVTVVKVEDIDAKIESFFSAYRQRVDSNRNNLKMEFWQLVMFYSKKLTANRRERISIGGYNNSTSIHALGMELTAPIIVRRQEVNK